MRVPNVSRAIQPRKLSANTSHVSTRQRNRPRAFRPSPWRHPPALAIFETEGWRVRKDGTRFWAHVVIDPIRDQNGELVGYAKVTRDLTERKKAEDALRRSEEQFKFLVQGVTDYAIYMLDAEGVVTNWNAGAQRIKGYAPEEIIGQHFSRFYTDEDRDQRRAETRLSHCRSRRQVRSRGMARAQGRHALLGACDHRCLARR